MCSIQSYPIAASMAILCFLIFSLQTGMRGAFGKPQGTVARVSIGQPLLSIRTKENHREKAVEALRRAKFKFPGRQKVCFLSILVMNTQLCDMAIELSLNWSFNQWIDTCTAMWTGYVLEGCVPSLA